MNCLTSVVCLLSLFAALHVIAIIVVYQWVVVVFVVVVDPAKAFFQMMSTHSLKSFVDPEYDANANNEDQNKYH